MAILRVKAADLRKLVISCLCLLSLVFVFSCEDDGISEAAKKYATEEIIQLTNTSGDIIYTGPRYNRQFQQAVQEILKNINQSDIYDNAYFRLDSTNTEHFYEDIGKNPHYVFGWADWFFQFAVDDSGNFVMPHWVLNGPTDDPNMRWIGNYPLWGPSIETIVDPSSNEASEMRRVYIKMID